MKYAHSDILDGGLTALKTAATRMLLVKTYASGDSYATVTGNQLGSVTMASADYTIGADGTGRKVTTGAGKTATASASSNQYDNGTASSGSTTTLVDSSKGWTTNAHANRAVTITGGTAKVLFVTDELTNQVITSGNTINFPQLEYASGQPV